MFRRALLVVLFLVAATHAAPTTQPAPPAPPNLFQRAARIEPLLDIVKGKTPRFRVSVSANGRTELGNHAAITVERFDEQTMSVVLQSDPAFARLERTADRTALILPNKSVAFVGEGPVNGPDTLAPAGLLDRLLGPGTVLTPAVAWVAAREPEELVTLAETLAERIGTDGDAWQARFKGDRWVTFKKGVVDYSEPNRGSVNVTHAPLPADAKFESKVDGFRVVKVDRREMERLISRGLRRALEVYAAAPSLTVPPRQEKTVEHGKLFWVEDQRVVLLWGTPEQIGRAHGELLAAEAKRCGDSVLCMVGLAHTVRSGRWFPDELRAIAKRVTPHIPRDHLAELDALAAAVGEDPEEVRLANVFPEMFHCSSFAAFGSATRDGKLYHGRVLDYMTAVGLQQVATVFVVKQPGKSPFVSVGYAGFTGVVSGMNDRQISLGQMGGRGGEGDWDGVPMATLMRRALEECSTLGDVKKLWTDSPRTCEHYFVWADGKIPSAVGAGATAKEIWFVNPGEAHPKLGPGIPDVVAISASPRLEALRTRLTEGHGKLDEATSIRLMDRPVAMKSNLHDVLFVPQDLVLHVAQAQGNTIACERPYVRLDLRELLSRMPE